jgi:hypothetical protein
MTTTSITLTLVALVAAVGIGAYGTRRVSALQDQLRTLQANENPLIEQASQARRELDAMASQLAVIQQQNEQLRQETRELPGLRGAAQRLQTESRKLAQLEDAISTTRSEPGAEPIVQGWLSRVGDLKQRLEQRPDQRIPELRFLTEQDWLNATRKQLDTDSDYRKAMAALRDAGQEKFALLACEALQSYLKGRDPRLDVNYSPRPDNFSELLLEHFPTDLSQLKLYFASPIDDAILQRWEILTGDKLNRLGILGPAAITQKALLDEEYDARWSISLKEISMTGIGRASQRRVTP